MSEILAPTALSTALILIATENLGVPYPTELSYLAVMGLVSAGELGFPEAVAAVSAAHLVGAVLGYELSRSGRGRVARWARARPRTRQAHDLLVSWFGRYGFWSILAARLIGYVRPWSSFAAGIAGMPRAPFVGAAVIGSVVHSWLALVVTNGVFWLWGAYPYLRPAIVIVGVLLFGGIWLAGWVRSRRRTGRSANA